MGLTWLVEKYKPGMWVLQIFYILRYEMVQSEILVKHLVWWQCSQGIPRPLHLSGEQGGIGSIISSQPRWRRGLTLESSLFRLFGIGSWNQLLLFLSYSMIIYLLCEGMIVPCGHHWKKCMFEVKFFYNALKGSTVSFFPWKST